MNPTISPTAEVMNTWKYTITSYTFTQCAN